MDLFDIERAIVKKYRKELYRPFIKAIYDYKLVEEGDKIAVCVSGGKDSFVLAKLFQEFKRHGDIEFDLEFIVMNPGFNKENLDQLIINSKKLDIPIQIKESNIFSITENHSDGKPCYLCARMRRGFLYNFASELGCNKIALAHHFNDVIETVLLNILYGGTFYTMMPKLKSKNYQGMELIRPLVHVHEDDIKRYMKYCKIEPMDCGCEVGCGKFATKRHEVKRLIANLKKTNDSVENNIYNSTANVNLDRLLGWKQGNEVKFFLDNYDETEDD
jgi:tRNA(Ile)-lysidine synthase TilS/MesJ